MNLRDLDVSAFFNTAGVGLLTLIVVFGGLYVIERIVKVLGSIWWVEEAGRWLLGFVSILAAFAVVVAIFFGILWEIGAFVQWVTG